MKFVGDQTWMLGCGGLVGFSGHGHGRTARPHEWVDALRRSTSRTC